MIKNFDIAAIRIHVRNWKIFNKIWPIKRIDLLSFVWQVLRYMINLVANTIGPKDQEI